MRTTRTPWLLRRPSGSAERQRGQALPLFVLMLVVIIGTVAIVTDVSWFWVGQQRMQRAADAAALAGAVFLPGDTTSAYNSARAEATKNGFTNGVGGVTVTPLQDATNRRRLIVTITGNIGTYFARVFGMTSVAASVTSRAEFVLPVPMGSPQNYYGVGQFVGSSSSTSSTTGNSNWVASTSVPSTVWTTPLNADATTNTSYAVSPTTNNTAQQWNGFNVQGGLPSPAANQTLTIDGLELELRTLLSGSLTPTTDCEVVAALSWDNGTTWSSNQNIILSTTKTLTTLGSAANTTAWGPHVWTRADFGTFRVRLTFTKPNCGGSRSASIDTIRVRASYTLATTTTTVGVMPVDAPGTSTPLAPQNFWGAMQSQGVVSIQGDAFMTQWQTRSSGGGASGATSNAAYDPNQYYNYGIDIPSGATGGTVWVFDPGFCDVATNRGTGEYWTGDNSTALPVSAFFELYDTRGTPYDLSDDTRVDPTGDDNTFRQLNDSDPILGGSGGTDCGATSWHNNWWQLATGLAGGTTYRLHTVSTDPNALSQQTDVTGLNAFAFYASATGGTPHVYGIGAMEAYVRLPGGQASEFYLARIDAVHAGKTLIIDLWDPGDTGALSASLEILQPTATVYAPATFSYTAAQGTIHPNASSCNALTGTNVTSVVTNTGGSSRFNGCWITIQIPLPSTYTAPHPSSDTLTTDAGWWKIRYTMGGAASSNSTDMTTWKVSIRGNPVHLVP